MSIYISSIFYQVQVKEQVSIRYITSVVDIHRLYRTAPTNVCAI